MGFISAHQSEEPETTTLTYIPNELPKFRKASCPTSNLSAPDAFVQDERGPLATIEIGEQPAASILKAVAEQCRKQHVGHIDRQQVSIQRCSIFSYRYRFRGNIHTIYINKSHNLVEDLDGPIQSTITGIDEKANHLFICGELGEAFRTNMMALCMDGATAEEKALRSRILKALAIRHVLRAGIGSVVAVLALLGVEGHLIPKKDIEWWGGSLLFSLILSISAVLPFSNDQAIIIGSRAAGWLSVLLGVLSSMVFASLNGSYISDFESHPVFWISITAILILVIGLPLTRREFKANLLRIEDSSWARAGKVNELEKFINSIKPSGYAPMGWLAFLAVLNICLFGNEVRVQRVVLSNEQRIQAEEKARLQAEQDRQQLAAIAEQQRVKLEADTRAKAEMEEKERQKAEAIAAAAAAEAVAEKERLRWEAEEKLRAEAEEMKRQQLAAIAEQERLRSEAEVTFERERRRVAAIAEAKAKSESEASEIAMASKLRLSWPFASGLQGRVGAITVRWVPAGHFTMGSPQSEVDRDSGEGQHEVSISRGFFLAETECTQGQWKAVMGHNPSRFKGTHRPVEQVSWQEAVDYCRKLTEKHRKDGALPEGWEWRLPTEAEWEYAARAGTTGAQHGALDAIAWHSGNSGGETHAVKGKQANAWGLYDMLGNVWEWCEDWYGDYPNEPVSNPKGSSSGHVRVDRGGSWSNDSKFARFAKRGGDVPGFRDCYLGFRPVLSSVR
jgi:formylglycine-generating enzyme required for sulfatase activity